MADIWSSCIQDSYLNILLFGNFHSDETIKEAIESVLNNFGIITKLLALVIDNITNMAKAFKLLKNKIERKCSGHISHLVIQEGYKINKLQKLCEHSEEMFYKPVIDKIIYWTSTYHM
ncbi:hypothetical protein BC936DRAFT_141025, partial [Jimgerdemannia flammicorona]